MDAAGALPPTTSTTTTATANSSTAREPAAATAARDAAVGGGAESSADENTGIARREIGAPPSRGYGTTTAAAEVRNGVGVGLGSRGSTSAASAGDGQLFKARKRKAAGKKGAVESSSSGRGGGGGAAPRGGDDGQQQQEEEEGEEGESWWKRVLDKYGSIELENKGSVARDHLALERTFLAWLRTSLSFASIGIAITQLFRLNTSISSSPDSSNDGFTHLRHVGKPLGATFLGISILVLFIGFHRYFESQHYVIRGKFPAGRGSIVLVALIAGALIVASLVVILAIKVNRTGK